MNKTLQIQLKIMKDLLNDQVKILAKKEQEVQNKKEIVKLTEQKIRELELELEAKKREQIIKNNEFLEMIGE